MSGPVRPRGRRTLFLAPLLVALLAVRYAERHADPRVASSSTPAMKSPVAMEAIDEDALGSGPAELSGLLLGPAGEPPPAGTPVYLASEAAIEGRTAERWRCLEDRALRVLDEDCLQAPSALAAALRAGLGRAQASRSAATDAAGRFRFSSIPSGLYAVWARAPKSALSIARSVQVSASTRRPLSLSTAFRARVSGQVLAAADARPLGQVVLTLLDPRLGHTVSARSEADGRFELSDLTPEVPYFLLAQAPGMAAAGRVVRAGEDVSLDLEDAAAVVGTVSSGGQAAAGATVEIDGGLETASTDARGAFRFEGLAPGRHVLLASSPAGTGRQHSFELARGVSRSVTLELTAVCPLAVKVEDPRGVPVAGADLRLNAKTSVDHRAAQTGPDGQVELPMVSAGTYEVEASHPDRGHVRQELNLSPPCSRRHLGLMLPDGPGVRGRVLDEDGAPLSEVELELAAEESEDPLPPERTTRTDELGRFSVPSLRPGRWVLGASKAGFVEAHAAVLMREPRAEEELELTLTEGSSIAGQLLDPEGRPVAGWVVGAVLPGPEAGSDPELGSTPLGRPQHTAADGRFRIEGLSPGRYLVSATPPQVDDAWAIDSSNTRTHAVLVDTGATDVVLHAPGSGVLAGTVRFEGAPAPESFSVAVPGIGVKSFDGARARFRFDGAIAAAYPIMIFAPGFSSTTVQTAVGRGETAELAASLYAAQELSGRVTDVHGDEPVAEATIAAWLENGDELATSVLATTRRDGRFELRGLAPGSHFVSAHGDGYAQVKLGPITLSPGVKARPLEIRLERARVELQGRLSLAGRPLGGASLLLAPLTPGTAGLRGASGPKGELSFEGVTPGDHLLTIASRRRRRETLIQRQRVHVPMSGLPELSIDVGEHGGAARLAVDVQSKQRGPVLITLRREEDGAELEAEDTTLGMALDAAPGRVVFERLAPGAYTVSAARIELSEPGPIGLATGTVIERRALKVEVQLPESAAVLQLD